ncbi:MAG: transpeptidase family protein [Bacteroidales bacterium]|nr:transpeptidase family protein [Bacteroidales bacterium]
MKWRVNLVYIGFLLVAFAIVLRIAFLIFIEGDRILEAPQARTTRTVEVEAMRGNIYSTDGNILVMTEPIFTVRMDLHHSVVPQDTFNFHVQALADSLARMFPQRSSGEWRRSLVEARNRDLGINPNTERHRGRGMRNFLIARNIQYNDLMRIQTFPILNRGRHRGGLVVEESSHRRHLHGQLARRTIGNIREDGGGVGLEFAFDDVLRGHSGKRFERQLARDVWIPIFNNQQEPQGGMDIVTTIDMRLQEVAHSALSRALRNSNATHGTAILMEVSTGKIRAISNLQRSERTGNFYETENFAINESVEPGSTFKLASLIAILEEGRLDTNDLVPTGRMRVGDRTMRDVRPEGHGEVTLKRAFELSSNVGIAWAARQTFSGRNERRFFDHFQRMRLHRPLGLEIPGERNPVVRTLDEKRRDNIFWAGSLEWVSMGYEVQMTPLQQLALYNAVANNGRMMRPMFVEEIRRSGRVVRRFEPTVLESRIASDRTLGKVRASLEGVVQNGTARSLSRSPYRIAGKTGTVQIRDLQTGAVTGHRASFIGYFPADNPKFSCLVIISNPSGVRFHGGEIAAPVFQAIADRVYATHMNLATELLEREDFEPLQLASNAERLYEIKELARLSRTLPSVRGMTAQDAVFLLESLGYRVTLNGRGIVREQSILAGTRIVSGQQITLRLS